MKIALCMLLSAGFAAGESWSANLLSVYRDALAYDAQFSAAKAGLKAGREKLTQGRAGLLPTIGIAANTTWNDANLHQRGALPTDTPFRYNSSGWTVVLTQPLFRWQNWETYNQSQLQVALAEAQFEAARQDLMVRAAQAYFDVLLAREAIVTVEAQKAAIAGQLRVAKRSFEVGTVTIVDIHEAQSRHDLATATEVAARNDLSAKRQALRKLTGKDDAALANLKPGASLAAPQPADIEKWVESAELANLAVRSAQAAYGIARHESGKQRAGHFPTLDFVATNGLASATGGASIGLASDTKATTIGLQLSIPIFAGGAAASRQREAVAFEEKALADLENARQSAALLTRQAYLDVASGLLQVKAYEAALASSQSALDSNKSGYDVGVRLNIDVLNAQSQLYDTRQKLVKARLDTVVAQLRLKAAVGSLSEEDLAASNSLLE